VRLWIRQDKNEPLSQGRDHKICFDGAKEIMLKKITSVIVIVLVLGLVWPAAGTAQEYKLDKGDLITVKFWQQPDLNTQVSIDAEGRIDLPLIGRIPAAGLTADQLGKRIVQKIAVYNNKITQASVTVNDYGSRRIYVTGAVTAPGKYSFEKIPTVWEAILEAGGPQPSAQLSAVQILRGGEKGQVIEVDLTTAFAGGDMSRLPMLQPGDNVNVPGAATPAGIGGGTLGASTISSKNAVYVFGYVAVPGVYLLEKDMDVLQAVVRAGGPVLPLSSGGSSNRPSREADLRNVKIITRGSDAPVVYSVNIETYTKHAVPVPLTLRPGDTIYIPGRDNYGRFVLGAAVGEVLKASVTVITTYIILNAIFNGNNNNNGNNVNGN
jgi:polysaccharide export outer membrane protein